MLAMPPDQASNELLEKIPLPIQFQEFLTNILPVYPTKLKSFKIFRTDNGTTVLNFPFNPPVTPIELMLQQALSQAANPQANQMLGGQINNAFGSAIMNILRQNHEVIEGETGITLDQLLTKECKSVAKEKKGSILLADATGEVEGDVLMIGMDF